MSFGKVFKKIAGAKPTSNYGQRMPLGTHTILLKNWEIKDTREDSEAGDYFIASSYLVESSSDPKVKAGESREWPWFVDKPGWAGKYALANAQAMSKAILDSFDFSVMPRGNYDAQSNTFVVDPSGQFILSPVTGAPYLIDDEDDPRRGQPKTEHDVATVSELCSQGFFRGIRIVCKVEPSFNKKTKKPNVNAQTGEQYTDALWKPAAPQSLDMLIAQRAIVDKIDPPGVKDDKPAAPAPPAQNVGGYAVQNQAAPVQPAPSPAQVTQAFLAAPVQPVAQPAATAPAPIPAPQTATGLAAMMGLKKPGA